jgi:sortase B
LKNNYLKRHILGLLIVVFALLFCVSAYMLIDYYLQGHKAEEAFGETRSIIAEAEADGGTSMQAALAKIYEQNNDFVGWLKIFGTDVDYPVVQTPDDPEYYLRRNFSKEYSVPGTLFASDISDIERPSAVILIYGHHMKNGTMFGPLMKYAKKSFYEDHRFLRFDTLRERRCYEIVNVFKISIGEDFHYYNYADFTDEADYNYFRDEIATRSLYDTGASAEFGDEFIMLSTCEYSQKNGRLVVLAKRVPEDAVTGAEQSQ